jgi:type III secretory pathway component EscS
MLVVGTAALLAALPVAVVALELRAGMEFRGHKLVGQVFHLPYLARSPHMEAVARVGLVALLVEWVVAVLPLTPQRLDFQILEVVVALTIMLAALWEVQAAPVLSLSVTQMSTQL